MPGQSNTATVDTAALPEAPSLEEVLSTAPAGPEEVQETVAPASDPITPESVQSDNAPDESLPDSSLIAQRLQRKLDESAAARKRQQELEEYKADQEELRQLRLLRRGELAIPQTQEAQDEKDEKEERIRRLEERLEAADRERQQQQIQRQMEEEQSEVVEWVSAHKEHFPMLNTLGHQALVYQKMRNEQYRTGQYISEAQAGREVEAEIVGIVHKCAPLLGYIKSNEAPRREEAVSVGIPNMSISDPINLDNLSDDDAIKMLVNEYQKTQR